MKRVLFFFLFLYCLFSAPCNTVVFPLITDLSSEDHVFCQYSDDVQYARKALAEGKTGHELPVYFYRYQAKKEDTIIRIAARCGILYDALVTINAIDSVKMGLAGKMLLLPTLPALYIPECPTSGIGKLAEAMCDKIDVEPLIIKLPSVENAKIKINYRCFPNVMFDGTTRKFFLTPYYCFPLSNAVMTSSFGVRKSPFTGKPSYHAGIDLAAPAGSPVYACSDGIVIETAYSHIYGNYIIIRHTDNRESLYGHLSTVCIRLHEKVKSGKIIGRVGSTGLSTGPHLHFEVREQGNAKDPALFFNIKKK